MEIPLSVAARVVRLDELSARGAVSKLIEPQAKTLDQLAFFYLCAYATLLGEQVFTPGQFDAVWQSLLAAKEPIAECLVGDTAQVGLGVANNRYCTHTGREDYIDLVTGDSVPRLPSPPYKSIVYDLSVSYRRLRSRTEKSNGPKPSDT